MKVLYVGLESPAFRTRMAVLQRHFEAFGCAPEEISGVLTSKTFDLILLSADLQQNQRSEIFGKTNGSAVVSLEHLTYPTELIALIHRAKAERVANTRRKDLALN